MALDAGGGIYFRWWDDSFLFTTSITNSILWNNSPDEIPNIGLSVIYSNILGGYKGTGNINDNPLFIDPNAGDYHLQPASPCIDTGTNEGAPYTDKDGNFRPNGAGYDMGAYEYDKGSKVVLFIIEDSCLTEGCYDSLNRWEVAYKFLLEEAGYRVIPMGLNEITASIDLSPYDLVYWTDYCGGGVEDPHAHLLIDSLVSYHVPFMTANPKFAILWGLATSSHPNYSGTEWLEDQTNIILFQPHPQLFQGNYPLPMEGDSISVYRNQEGGDPPSIGVLADDATLSADAIKIAKAYDTINGLDKLAIIEFPAGANQPNDSNGHSAPMSFGICG